MKTQFIEDILKGPGNRAWEIARVGLAGGIVSMLGFQGFAIFSGQTFDPTNFGIGYAALLAGGGAAAAAKDMAGRKPTAPVKVAGDLNAENIENVQTGVEDK